ncbi:ABC superfamily ATP binding cassette transporter, membrane protein [Treponema paraluiscuniculi Cuniculi A]|uniref:ABC superfamily ATP binding cassette transporter, membrane protein n=3 Tax=Treponema paraluiscuniculi TaxID=53435 RepID=F7XT53_TREPU|nr:Fe-S cluster assembly protein SufD [Treponema paraluiscuniculi]AEH40550.1 ABC superfamily ATP binding cassette transporter, membrane protein [Treponema paraluiscuniculi Cuniculi A]WKC72478.1 ABC superfamily ATP binding cassette transporter, membrane protein [Treponema paraluiscuniculi]
MKKREFFKRLGYHAQDVASQPFSRTQVTSSSALVRSSSIEHFLCTEPERAARAFDFRTRDRQRHCGLGEAYVQEVKEKRNAGVYLSVPRTSETVHVLIRFTMDTHNRVLYDQTFLDIQEGARVKVLVCVDAQGYAPQDAPALVGPQALERAPFRNGLVSVQVGRGASVELIKVQNTHPTAVNFETVHLHAQESAQVRCYDVQIGAQISGVSNSAFLRDEWARVEIHPLYFIDKTRRMDLEHNLIVEGKNSHAHICACGVVKDGARKTFRGNIFLHRGCSHSVARFSDRTILLDRTAVGVSIPTIFCDEDDVVGEHAASFETIGSDVLYYLMSRGPDEYGAKRLIIEAAFKPVFALIDDTHIRETLIRNFDESLDRAHRKRKA